MQAMKLLPTSIKGLSVRLQPFSSKDTWCGACSANCSHGLWAACRHMHICMRKIIST